MNLYELTQAQADLIAQIDTYTDPETGELSEAYANALDAAEIATADKLAAVEAFRRGLQAEAAAFKAEEERLSKRRKALEGRDEALKKYIASCLTLAGLDHLKAGTFDFRMQANPPAVMLCCEPAELPAEYRKATWTADKKAIGDALKRGDELEFAVLSPSKSLRVR
jgi:hypothetical protein